MKKILQLVPLSVLFGLTLTASAQKKANGKITVRADRVFFDKDPTFVSEELIYDDSLKVTTMNKNVSLKTDKFQFENADKVVYNDKTGKLIIYDCKKIAFEGTVVVKDKSAKTNIIEYTLGDDTMYLF